MAVVDQSTFRQVLGHFPTGVTVVTAMADGDPVGLAVGSFASVSLEPPMVLFCAAHASTSWPKIEAAGVFCVNVLAQEQEHVSRVFATSGTDKWRGMGWRPSPSGCPLLEGVLAWIDCRITQVTEAGDHWVVIGQVDELEVAHEGLPLVFFRGGYGRFEA